VALSHRFEYGTRLRVTSVRVGSVERERTSEVGGRARLALLGVLVIESSGGSVWPQVIAKGREFDGGAYLERASISPRGRERPRR
jgi:hypothetical protein